MRPKKILLVDDEAEFSSTLAERLTLRGFESDTAPDGESALVKIEEEEWGVAVVDLMMPGMGGLATLKRIKAIRPDLPVILLTGHGSTKEGMEGMSLGAFDYLIKPLAINELIEKIYEALAG